MDKEDVAHIYNGILLSHKKPKLRSVFSLVLMHLFFTGLLTIVMSFSHWLMNFKWPYSESVLPLGNLILPDKAGAQ